MSGYDYIKLSFTKSRRGFFCCWQTVRQTDRQQTMAKSHTIRAQ